MQKSYFAENLRNLRKYKKISLEQLSEAINVSKSAISDYENEKSSPPLAICKKISVFFGMDIDKIENSEILEISKKGEWILKPIDFSGTQERAYQEKIENLENDKKRLDLQHKLQAQKIESLQIQLRLHDQLKEGKLSEIELLKTQIRLMEDKIKMSIR